MSDFEAITELVKDQEDILRMIGVVELLRLFSLHRAELLSVLNSNSTYLNYLSEVMLPQESNVFIQHHLMCFFVLISQPYTLSTPFTLNPQHLMSLFKSTLSSDFSPSPQACIHILESCLAIIQNMAFTRQDLQIHILMQEGLVALLIDIWDSQLEDKDLASKWKELQKIAMATISRIQENCETIEY